MAFRVIKSFIKPQVKSELSCMELGQKSIFGMFYHVQSRVPALYNCIGDMRKIIDHKPTKITQLR